MISISTILGSLLLLSACGGGGGKQDPPITVPPNVPILGCEYARPQHAQAMAGSGAVSAKCYPSLGTWGDIQSSAGAAYNWTTLDAFVLAYQQAGFRNLTLMLSSHASWADIDPPSVGHRGNTFPKPEYEGAYAAFIQALVERYDFDGKDDMPGLLAPVKQYGLEAEYSSFWPGDAASYVKLMGLAYPAMKAANPNAKLLIAGLLMAGTFEGYPSAAQIQSRLASPDPRIFDKSASDIALVLDHPECFDVVDFHALSHYSEIPTTVSWLRSEMSQRGYSKPIWIGDTWGGAGLNGWGPAACPAQSNSGLLEYPATETNRCAIAATLNALANTNDTSHDTAIAWIRAESASGTVRKVALATALGLAGINIGNTEDWEPLMLTLGAAGTSPWQGMLDRNILTMQVTGYRPSYYALKQISALLDRTNSAERLSTFDNTTYILRFNLKDGTRAYVAWADTGLWLPPAAATTRTVELDLGFSGAVRLEWTVTSGSTPRTENRTTTNGKLSLELGPVPVFIWP